MASRKGPAVGQREGVHWSSEEAFCSVQRELERARRRRRGRRGRQGQPLWVVLRILIPGKLVMGSEARRRDMISLCLETHLSCMWKSGLAEKGTRMGRPEARSLQVKEDGGFHSLTELT